MWRGLRGDVCGLRRDGGSGLGSPHLAFALCSLASLFGFGTEAGKCARRRTYFLCVRQRKQAKKGGPTSAACASLRANLRWREPVRRLGASDKNSDLGGAARRSAAARLRPCKDEQRRRPPKALFCSRARAAGRLTTAAARQNSLCDLRSRRSDNCRKSDHDASTCCAVLARRRHRPRRRCLKGWAMRALCCMTRLWACEVQRIAYLMWRAAHVQ